MSELNLTAEDRRQARALRARIETEIAEAEEERQIEIARRQLRADQKHDALLRASAALEAIAKRLDRL